MRMLLLCLCLCCLAFGANARAAECGGPFAVGFRKLSLADGRDVSVWYPLPSASSGANDRAAQGCPRLPLVLFSHGLAGCGTQSVFITEEIARHGYVVAAPDHRDAICGTGLLRKLRDRSAATKPSFLEPQLWTDAAWRDRMLDLRETLRVVLADPELEHAIDASRIGLMGHSLGGYTVIGMAGAWPGWDLPGVRAVLAFSPYVEAYIAQDRLAQLRVPVMYQDGTLDLGIASHVVGPGGAYAKSPAPKYLVELADATHMAWTNLPCGDSDTADCLAAVPNARLVDDYAIAFLDRDLKGQPSPLLDGRGVGLAEYRASPSR